MDLSTTVKPGNKPEELEDFVGRVKGPKLPFPEIWKDAIPEDF